MPWRVSADHRCPVTKPYAVVRADTNEMVACHATRGEATQHMQALYANEPEARADNPKEPYGPSASAHYADPGYKPDKQKRYPLDTEAHARAALSYFSMPKNHAGYSAEQVAAIMGRIKAACRKFGIEVAEDKENRGAVYSYADIVLSDRR